MFRYNVNNINVRKENIISVCVPIKGLWRHSWRQKAIFPKSITWCLLTHQTCKEGRFLQPLWFCGGYQMLIHTRDTINRDRSLWEYPASSWTLVLPNLHGQIFPTRIYLDQCILILAYLGHLFMYAWYRKYTFYI